MPIHKRQGGYISTSQLVVIIDPKIMKELKNKELTELEKKIEALVSTSKKRRLTIAEHNQLLILNHRHQKLNEIQLQVAN